MLPFINVGGAVEIFVILVIVVVFEGHMHMYFLFRSMNTLFCIQVEPQLKYERMSNDLASILSRDAASCLAVHSKVICMQCMCCFAYIHNVDNEWSL